MDKNILFVGQQKVCPGFAEHGQSCLDICLSEVSLTFCTQHLDPDGLRKSSFQERLPQVADGHNTNI